MYKTYKRSINICNNEKNQVKTDVLRIKRKYQKPRKPQNTPEKKKEGKKKEKNMTERRKIKIEINGKEHETYVYA